MINISFNFESMNIDIQANLDENMMDVINRYITKTRLDIENIYFLYNGIFLDKELVVNQVINKLNREEKKMAILVNLLDYENKNTNTKDSFII